MGPVPSAAPCEVELGDSTLVAMEAIREQMVALLDQGLYDSAELLGGFLLSATVASGDLAAASRADNLMLFGDALYGRREYRRALSMYRQAQQHCRMTPKPPGGRIPTPQGTRPLSNSSTQLSHVSENEVRYKIGLCHLAVQDVRAALAEMEGIPPRARTLRINLVLAKLYRMTGYERASIASYRECLRQNPYLLEAIIALAELGVPAKEICALFPQGAGKSSRPNDHMDQARWLQTFVEGHCSIAQHDQKGGLEHFNSLSQRFPNNLHIQLETAKAETVLGMSDQALHSFEKARQLDPFNLTSMDEYAMLLRQRSDNAELNRLVHDMLGIDPTRPEVWVASAVYWDTQDDKPRALSYSDKSVQADERHVTGYILKGNLSLTLNRHEAAVMAFRKAQSLKADLRSYQGLVRAYLALSKQKEALCVAREAMKAMPHSAKALTLVGDVYAHTQDGREKARKFYESALRLEPGYLGAVLSLADLNGKDGRVDEAMSLLHKYLKNWADDALHTKLAQVLASTNRIGESLSHYQAALSINPLNDAAKKGSERLAKLMKGLDPDALEDEEEHESEEVDGQPEDSEFLSTHRL